MTRGLLPVNDFSRKIIHLDMDAFYASVEHRDHPELKHKAIVVGHDPRQNNGHGVVATADYLARSYGVHSAMPAFKAIQLIPANKLVFVSPNFEKYRAVSAQVHAFMHELTDKIEPISLDEAYLDVTENKLHEASAIKLGNYLQEKIFKQLHLTSSFGVSYNKFLAKLGSEYAKPFGKTVILPEEAEEFLADKDISQFPGIGKKTQESLKAAGIVTGRDLQAVKAETLIAKYKKFGYLIAMHAHGIDLQPVVYQRQAKSLGKERTFEPNLFAMESAEPFLRQYSQQLAKSLRRRDLMANCVVLKIRDRDFHTVTKRKKLNQASQDPQTFYQEGRQLLASFPQFFNQGVRLLGLTVTDLTPSSYQEVDLFTDED